MSAMLDSAATHSFRFAGPGGRTTARLSAATRRRALSCGAVALDLKLDSAHATREGRQHRYRDNFLRSTVSTLRSAVMRRIVARGQLECVCPWRLAPSEPGPRREHRSPPAVREAWHHHLRCVLTHSSPSVVLELDPAGSCKPLAREQNCELDELG